MKTGSVGPMALDTVGSSLVGGCRGVFPIGTQPEQQGRRGKHLGSTGQAH